MRNKLFLILFFSIFLTGTLLRFYQLGSVPGSLEWDEVSYAYNAYSILETGKDEYGEFLPTAFRAFGEYKQPVYSYLTVASIAIFGLTDFAVRFPAALFGSISSIFVYLLVYELFKKTKFARTFALLSMFFFAISPWSIQFSRGAFEATVALCFVIAGVWLFLRGLSSKKNWHFFVAIIILSLSTYTYISQKLIVPLLIGSLIIYGLAYFKKQRKLTILLVALAVLLNTLWLFDAKSVSRGQGVFVTNNQTEILQESIQQMQSDKEFGDQLGSLLHNRRIVYTQKVIENYLSHFNPVWLFFIGDKVDRHHAPGFGQLYLLSLPFILLGMYFLLSRWFSVSWIIFVWFLIAPVAAALTFEAPHALRSLIFLPTWHIFEAAGVVFLLQKITRPLLLRSMLIVLSLLLLLNFIYFLHQYFVHTNTDFQKDWQYGYKEAIISLDEYKDNTIIFSSNFEQPYIFYLYYTKYDPAKYIASGGSWRTSKKCYTIDTVNFGDCKDKVKPGDIFVSAGDTTLPNTKVLKEFKYKNGKPATRVFEVR